MRAHPPASDRVADALVRYRRHAARCAELAERRDRMPSVPAVQATEPGPAPLTARELQVLQLVADGHTTEQIANALVLTHHTVKSHLKRILAKLQAHNRSHAVALAIRAGSIR